MIIIMSQFLRVFFGFIGYFLTRKYPLTWHNINSKWYFNTYLKQLINLVKVKIKMFFQIIGGICHQQPIVNL